MRRFVALALSLTAFLAAQAPPTFRAGTRLVQVDVIVRDGRGPVASLTKDDFTLLDNGRTQKIAFFSVRSAPNSAPVQSAAPAVPPPAGVISNRLNRQGDFSGTATILLVDRVNTVPALQPFVHRQILKFLETRGNHDSIGIYTLGTSLRAVQDLTSDADRLVRAAKSLKPENPNRRSTDTTGMWTGFTNGSGGVKAEYEEFLLRERVRDTKGAFEEIARHLESVPGRKSLVWISSSFPLIIKRPGGAIIDFNPDIEAAARALNKAHVALYAVDSRGLMASYSGSTLAAVAPAAEKGPSDAVCRKPGDEGCMPLPQFARDSPLTIDTMNKLAGLTGGRVFTNTNGIEDSIRKAVEDAEVTYTLGFYPSQESQDGKYHKLTVKVSRRSLSVHHMDGYFAFKNDADVDRRATLEELVQEPLDASGVSLLAQVAPDATKPSSYQIKVNVDLHDLQLEHENARYSGAVDLLFFIEGSGKGRTTTVKLDIPDEQFAAAIQKGIDVSDSVQANGKAQVLRVVAQDQATGVAGSITVPLSGK